MFLLFLPLESFYHKWILNFVKGFLCIYCDNHMDFIFQFVNAVYYIDLRILKNPCIPGIKPTWSCCMIFLMCCWILIAIAWASKIILNNSGESGHACLVPDLRGNAFSFSGLRIMFAVGLSYMAFTILR